MKLGYEDLVKYAKDNNITLNEAKEHFAKEVVVKEDKSTRTTKELKTDGTGTTKRDTQSTDSDNGTSDKDKEADA